MSTFSKSLKIIAIILLSLIGLVILVFGGYVIYLCCQYYRIPDNTEITVNNNISTNINLNTQYTITTFNIGFGAYSQDFSFFMDSGELKDGTKTQGTGSKAKSKEEVLKNTNGAINAIKSINSDFMFFQEVDTKANRSHFVNQYEMLQNAFNQHSSAFAYNFHSAYLFYPILDPHGASDAGIATFSKYNIESAVRKSFPIDESFPAKFFDLDRCFSVYTLPIANTDKKLILINLHMSAYDEGGVIRAQQLEKLTAFVSAEHEKGNYVIAGGDWNHDIANSSNTFESGEKKPEWVATINDEDIPAHFSFAQAINAPTCRSTDIAYTKDANGNIVNYRVVVDGFLVSDNVRIDSVENIDLDFEFSDHNPAKLQFTLL